MLEKNPKNLAGSNPHYKAPDYFRLQKLLSTWIRNEGRKSLEVSQIIETFPNHYIWFLPTSINLGPVTDHPKSEVWLWFYCRPRTTQSIQRAKKYSFFKVCSTLIINEPSNTWFEKKWNFCPEIIKVFSASSEK